MMIRKCMRVGSVRTSIKLEVEFWSFLEELAAGRGLSLARFVSEVANAHPDRTNLASTLRLFVLAQARGTIRQAEVAADRPPTLVCPLLRLLPGRATVATAATDQIADRRSLPADQERMGVADPAADRLR
jgi:predicted DNA-binding ribbon-helix-helix protein